MFRQTAEPDDPAEAPDDPSLRQKRQIIASLKGPVAARLQELIPTLAPLEDPYHTAMENPELLFGCLQVFRKQRGRFAEFLVDAGGRPVADDDTPLSCGRSVNDIIGMIVRSGARQYAMKRFVAQEGPAHIFEPLTRTLLDALARLVAGRWGESERPRSRPDRAYAEEFYEAIRDQLEHDWQVPLIPHYAELPARLIRELGRGLGTLHNPAAIAALANIGRHNMDEARRILSEPMMREMLDNQPLAAQGIAFLGKANYEFLHGAVYGRMGVRFWEMCRDTERLAAMAGRNARDLAEMSGYLHLLGAETISRLIETLQPFQLSIFLETALQTLGEEQFTAIFGVGGKAALARLFIERAAAFKLEPTDAAADFGQRLPDIFRAYLLSPKSYEKGL